MEEERSEPSPGALRDRVPGGGGRAAPVQTSEHQAEDPGGESAARGDTGAARGAALGVGRPVWGPPPSSQCWEARWREGTEEGRKEGSVSRRAGTGRGTGRLRRGGGREGKGRRDPVQTARLLRRAAAVGQGKPGALRGSGRGNGSWDGGGSRGSLPARSLPRLPGAVRPALGWGWEAPAFPALALRWCQVLEQSRPPGATRRHAPLPYFLPLFLRTSPRVRSPGTGSALRV